MEILIGTIVSLIIQFTKKKLGLSSFGVLIAVVILALLGSIIYSLLSTYGLLEAFVEILITAGAFYAFIIKNITDIADERYVAGRK